MNLERMTKTSNYYCWYYTTYYTVITTYYTVIFASQLPTKEHDML